MNLYAIEIKEQIEEEIFNKLISCVNEEKRIKVKRFIFKEDSDRALLSETLIRFIICDTLNINNSSIRFLNNKYGKPFLSGYKNFQFNISHSGSFVICGVDDFSIGVDVEKIRKIDFELPKRYFSKVECDNIFNRSEDTRLDYFFRLWTLKESYVKALGKGLSVPLNSFAVNINDSGITISTENKHDSSSYYFNEYDIHKEYKFSICAKNNAFPKKIIITDVNAFISKILNDKRLFK